MFRLIDEEKTRHSVSLMSRLLGVSRQGYYKHHHRIGVCQVESDRGR
ncbi:hypothetical protein HNR07_003077 [Nocardiopsis metallicus]|uniref:Uncharacterized protein n=1 Tax=Nocardiopsis metallicus TaxID=179819 RepID=A0A840W4Q0_9ACTN|nr:hypothetical protein [Nocardiopsis metallicus]